MERVSMRSRMEGVANLLSRGIIRLEFERMLEHVYRQILRPGDTVIDIGAHAGRHLRPLLECIGESGRAIAFEPLPFAYERLCSTLSHPNLSLHNIALSNKDGEFDFTFAEGSPEESGLIQRTFNAPEVARPRTIRVKVHQLDEFTQDLGSVSYIKIDIEGAEIDCLRGAGDVLKRLRPIISVEYGSLAFKAYGHVPESLYDLAAEAGYVLFDIFLNRLEDRTDWVEAVDFLCWDFFMVPGEKADQFAELAHTKGALPYLQEVDSTTQSTPLQLEATQAAIDLQGGELGRMDSLHEHLRQENSCLREELRALRNSTSWRATEPLRKVLSSLRR